MSYVEKIRPRLDAFFLRQPRAPYGRQAPRSRAGRAMTYGYYQKPTAAEPTGRYMYNGSDLRTARS
jgi:uncharacterized protein (DUF885 family)